MATYSEQDKAALLAMVTRYTAQQAENAEILKAREELDQKLALGQAQIQRLIAAFAAFGFDVSVPKDDKAKKPYGFQLIRNVVGSKAYLAAFAAGGKDPSNTATRDEDGDQNTQQTSYPALPLPEPADDKSIRDLTLAELISAGTSGTTATAIRKQIERGRATQLHFKTVGMTLYRLSKEGLARREGRTWFIIPKMVNPGAATPGSINRGT
jgi:hypothetical protein